MPFNYMLLLLLLLLLLLGGAECFSYSVCGKAAWEHNQKNKPGKQQSFGVQSLAWQHAPGIGVSSDSIFLRFQPDGICGRNVS